MRGPGKISRVGSRHLRGILYMRTLSAKRTKKALADFVQRMAKPGKLILVDATRKLLVHAPVVIRAKAGPALPGCPSSI